MSTKSNFKSLTQDKFIQNPYSTDDNSAFFSQWRQDQKEWHDSNEKFESFWRVQAERLLHWKSKWHTVFAEKENHKFNWFSGGKLNVSYNCLDRHLHDKSDKLAVICESEDGTVEKVTYRQLHQQVVRFSNVLKNLGITSEDVVSVYMPMSLELVIVMLACARLGAMHNVIFPGFSAESIRDRLNDCSSKIIVTADGTWRKGKVLPLKNIVDKSLVGNKSVENVIIWDRGLVSYRKNLNDLDWHQLMQKVCLEENIRFWDSEHPLFLLYTSGSTGKPKGLVHTSAGYLLGATLSSRYIFDLHPDDIYWCTADIGWITGHSYVVYGPLSNGSTIFLYEGAPSFPKPGRFWNMIEKHKISKFYTAPTAIRMFMSEGVKIPHSYDLSSLKILGSVGEPINPDVWLWFFHHIGQKRCPVVDTWWQTETGSIMISPLPFEKTLKPGSASKPLPGLICDIVDEKGNTKGTNTEGFLVVRKPWPSMARTIYNNHDRFVEQYWQKIPGVYFTGDGAKRDEDGFYWLLGRVDDVLNVSGHRLSTMEMESALVSYPSVVEAAVVGRPDDITGEAIFCFVVIDKIGCTADDLVSSLKQHVRKKIGAIAVPKDICIVEQLPKTRSGKIMRRLLRDHACGRSFSGDLSTIEDRAVLKSLQKSKTLDLRV